MLRLVGRHLGFIRSYDATSGQTSSRTDTRPPSSTRSNANRCAHCSTHSRATRKAIVPGLISRAAYLHIGILSACHIIGPKLLEVFPRSW